MQFFHVNPFSASAVFLLWHCLVSPPALPPVVPNDNRTPAGTLSDGVLSLELRAAVGLWQPGGKSGPALTVQAFGHDAAPLSAPAPLIRVPEGTQIDVRVRNELSDSLRVFGLCDRAAACVPLDVPAGETPPAPLRQWTGRHLSLLGHHHRHAAAVQGGR